jgi:hypothetical protein
VVSLGGMNYCFADSLRIDRTSTSVLISSIEVDGEVYGKAKYGECIILH